MFKGFVVPTRLIQDRSVADAINEIVKQSQAISEENAELRRRLDELVKNVSKKPEYSSYDIRLDPKKFSGILDRQDILLQDALEHLDGAATPLITKASGAEVIAGTNDTKYTTPKSLADSDIARTSSIPVKASGAELDTGTDDAKFATAKALADSAYAKTSDIPVKATGAELDTGTDDAKYATAKALADSAYAKTSDIPSKASSAEIITGTDDDKFTTPKGIYDAKVGQLEEDVGKYGVVMSPDVAWEGSAIAEQNILYEGGSYKMWYRGNAGVNSKLGYATSSDMITWTKYGSNPISLTMPSGKTCAYYYYILKVSGTYYLYASVYPGDNLYRWSSADGLSWNLDNSGNPVLETGSGWEANAICNPAVIYDDDQPTYKWQMIYEALGSAFQIGYAYSSDGLSWTKYSGNPVLPAISGTWRHTATGNPELFKHNGVYYAIYGGVSSAGLWTIGVSRSFDMINWDDYDFNPLIYSTEAYEGDHCTDVGVVKNADGSLHDAVGLRYSTYLHYGADQKDIALATFKRLRLAEFLKLTEPPLLSSMINPMTTDGDIIYGGLSGIPSRLAANNTGTRKYLSQISGGTPSWETVSGGGGVSYYKQVFTADGTWSHPNPGNAIPIVVTLLGPGGDGGAGGNGGNGSTGYIGGGGGGGGGGEDGQMIVYSATQEQDLVITINTGTKTEVTGSGFSTKTASKASNGANGAAGTNATAANGVPGLSGKGFLPGAAAAETATSGTGRDGGSASHAKFGAGGAAGASNQNGSAGSAGENGGTYGAGGAGGGGGGGGNGNGKTGGSGGAGGIGASGFVIVEWWA